MSQEAIDMARRGYEAFSRRDLDAALEMLDPQVEAHDPPEVPDAAVHRGREAVRRDWEQTLELFDDLKIDIEDVFDSGGEEIVLFVRYSGRGRESGAAVEARTGHVWTFREGRAIRLRQYLDRAQALEAAGLAEQEVS
jgi:uncharacterized protein